MRLGTNDNHWKIWISVVASLLLAVALALTNHKMPVIDLTTLGKTLVVAVGIIAAIGVLVLLAVQSQSGTPYQQLTYMRQTRHKRWLGTIFSAAAVIGLMASLFARTLMGHVMQLIPAREYSTIRAEVLDRTSDEGDMFNCKHTVVVRTDAGEKYSLCLEHGFWWRSVPDSLGNVKAGDQVVVYLRQTVLGVGAEVNSTISPRQDFHVE